MHNLITTFIENGAIPASPRERGALLADCRNEILSLRQTPPNKQMILFNKKLTALQQALIEKGHPPKVADIQKPAISNSAETGRFTNAAEIISEGEKILAMMKENRANAQPTAINRATTATASSKTPSLDSLAARIKTLTASAKAIAAQVTASKATAAAPADLLDEYSAMSAGPAKIKFLAQHSMEIQSLAKARAKDAR